MPNPGKDGMDNWLESLSDHAPLIGWIAAVSAVLCLGSLVLVPALVVRIPHDYFTHARRHPAPWAEERWLFRAIVLVLKNALGGVLVIAGITMLVLPGQGIVTILMGLFLLDFPGKFHLERWLVSRGPTLRAINWLRRRANRPPLVVDK